MITGELKGKFTICEAARGKCEWGAEWHAVIILGDALSGSDTLKAYLLFMV